MRKRKKIVPIEDKVASRVDINMVCDIEVVVSSFTYMYYRGIKFVTLIFVIFYRYAEF